MRLRTLNLLAAAVGAAFITTAMAQTGGTTAPGATKSPSGTAQGAPPASTGSATGTTGKADFTSLDRDKDGFISRSEASQGGLSASFQSLDKNNDGRLDRSELSASATGGTGSGAGSDMGSSRGPVTPR